jgi:hypothetical protein
MNVDKHQEAFMDLIQRGLNFNFIEHIMDISLIEMQELCKRNELKFPLRVEQENFAALKFLAALTLNPDKLPVYYYAGKEKIIDALDRTLDVGRILGTLEIYSYAMFDLQTPGFADDVSLPHRNFILSFCHLTNPQRINDSHLIWRSFLEDINNGLNLTVTESENTLNLLGIIVLRENKKNRGYIRPVVSRLAAETIYQNFLINCPEKKMQRAIEVKFGFNNQEIWSENNIFKFLNISPSEIEHELKLNAINLDSTNPDRATQHLRSLIYGIAPI